MSCSLHRATLRYGNPFQVSPRLEKRPRSPRNRELGFAKYETLEARFQTEWARAHEAGNVSPAATCLCPLQEVHFMWEHRVEVFGDCGEVGMRRRASEATAGGGTRLCTFSSPDSATSTSSQAARSQPGMSQCSNDRLTRGMCHVDYIILRCWKITRRSRCYACNGLVSIRLRVQGTWSLKIPLDLRGILV